MDGVVHLLLEVVWVDYFFSPQGACWCLSIMMQPFCMVDRSSSVCVGKEYQWCCCISSNEQHGHEHRWSSSFNVWAVLSSPLAIVVFLWRETMVCYLCGEPMRHVSSEIKISSFWRWSGNLLFVVHLMLGPIACYGASLLHVWSAMDCVWWKWLSFFSHALGDCGDFSSLMVCCSLIIPLSV